MYHNIKSVCGNIELVKELQELSRIRTFEAKQTIIAEGDKNDIVGVVLSGALQAKKTMPDGRNQVVSLLLTPDIFGSLFAELSLVTVEASVNSVLRCYNRTAFERVFAKYPEFLPDVCRAMARELDMAREWMLLLGCQTAQERVASFLLMMREKTIKIRCANSAAAQSASIPIPFKRSDIASFIGIAPETTSRILNEISRDGIIQFSDLHHFDVLDNHRLLAIAGRTECGLEQGADERVDVSSIDRNSHQRT